MDFRKFTSIENSYRSKTISAIRETEFNRNRWLLTEKVHGANFSFWSDGNEIRVASRTAWVDGTFYKCQDVIDRYSDMVKWMHENRYADAKVVAVYGELYGPGIQKGVWYGPDKNWIGFEVVVDGVVEPAYNGRLSMATAGLPTTPIVDVVENLDEVLRIDNEFQSMVSTEYLTPDQLEDRPENNVAEGWVAIPYHDVGYLGNGDRIILKSKNDKFKEKEKKEKKPSEPNPFIGTVEQYVNRNRMDAVISKMGPLEPKDFGRVIRAMADDVIEDMVRDEDLPEDWKSQDEFKPAGKAVSTVVSKFLKEELLPEL